MLTVQFPYPHLSLVFFCFSYVLEKVRELNKLLNTLLDMSLKTRVTVALF